VEKETYELGSFSWEQQENRAREWIGKRGNCLAFSYRDIRVTANGIKILLGLKEDGWLTDDVSSALFDFSFSFFF